MNSYFFKRTAEFVPGEYFLGHYTFLADATVFNVRLECWRPTAAPVTVELEVDGDLAGKQVVVTPGVGRCETVVALNLRVLEGSEVRWKVVSYAGTIEGAARNGGLVMEMFAGEVVEPTTEDKVVWVNGEERLDLFSYDRDDHSFTEIVTGLATGRAALMNVGPDTSFAIVIKDVAVLVVDEDGVQCTRCVEGVGLVLDSLARLEFWSEGVLVAAVDELGALFGASFTEGEEVEGEVGFDFYGGGGVGLAANVGGIQAVGFEGVG